MQMFDYWVRKGLKLRTKADVTVHRIAVRFIKGAIVG